MMPRPRPKSPSKPAAAKTRVPSAAPFPTLQEFIDNGGHIEIGHVDPIACAAIANDDHNMRVALRRRSHRTPIGLS